MIECKGYFDGNEYDCKYSKVDFECDDCIVNGGCMSPRTGKKFRGNVEKYETLARERAEREVDV